MTVIVEEINMLFFQLMKRKNFLFSSNF